MNKKNIIILLILQWVLHLVEFQYIWNFSHTYPISVHNVQVFHRITIFVAAINYTNIFTTITIIPDLSINQLIDWLLHDKLFHLLEECVQCKLAFEITQFNLRATILLICSFVNYFYSN